MLSSARPNENTLVVRNYLIALTSAVVLSFGIADAYYQPSRVAHQGRLDNYGRFVSVGVVTYSQKIFAR